jgi:uncharacterized membrane protein
MNHPTLGPILATILGVPGKTFWPYFSGTLLLLLGLGLLLWTEAPRCHGLDRMIVLGRVLFAAPMAVFGTEHFVLTDDIARLVPSWMPGHLFWTYLTGTGLIAAALSIVVRKHSGLAAMLLGVMLFSFALLIWLPQTVATAGNRFALAVLLREIAFGSGSFALAVTEGFGPLARRSKRVIPLARLGIGVPVIVFGVEHFLHPSFVPVVPLRQPMPTWIPAGIALVYGMGATMIACGAGIVFDRNARSSAAVLGTAINLVVLLVYVPLLVAQPSVAVGLNYFADTLAFGGTVLLLARALDRGLAAGKQAPRAEPMA